MRGRQLIPEQHLSIRLVVPMKLVGNLQHRRIWCLQRQNQVPESGNWGICALWGWADVDVASPEEDSGFQNPCARESLLEGRREALVQPLFSHHNF